MNRTVVWYTSGRVDHKISTLLDCLRADGISLHRLDTLSGWQDNILLVLWTRDELEHQATLSDAASASLLVSVLIEKRALFTNIAPHPVIDLANWRSSSKNPDYRDLVDVLRAKEQDLSIPKLRGPRLRKFVRLCKGVSVVAILGGCLTIAMSIVAVQNNLCSIGFVQPGISDICGRFGLGNKPTKTERLAWENRLEGNCDALRQHIEQFPAGAYRQVAADMLEARLPNGLEQWFDEKVRLSLFVTLDTEGGATLKETAQQNAMERGHRDAEKLCKGFAVTGSYRFVSATSEVQDWQCDETRSGFYCAFEGEAVCSLERLERQETCGTIATTTK